MPKSFIPPSVTMTQDLIKEAMRDRLDKRNAILKQGSSAIIEMTTGEPRLPNQTLFVVCQMHQSGITSLWFHNLPFLCPKQNSSPQPIVA